jgi:hypothetical protein
LIHEPAGWLALYLTYSYILLWHLRLAIYTFDKGNGTLSKQDLARWPYITTRRDLSSWNSFVECGVTEPA